MLRVEIPVARTGDAHLNILWKDMLEYIARAPRVKIRCDNDHPVPFSFFHKPRKRLRYFQSTVRIVYKPHDPVSWHSALDQVVLHQLSDPRIGPQASPARYNHGRLPFPEQLRSSCRPIGIKIIIAQDDERVRFVERIFDYPRLRCKTKYGTPYQVQDGTKDYKTQQYNQIEEDSA